MDITKERVEAFFNIQSDLEDRILIIANRVFCGMDSEWDLSKFYLGKDNVQVELSNEPRCSCCGTNYDDVEFPVDLIWRENGIDEALDLRKKRKEEKERKREEAIILSRKDKEEKQKAKDLEDYARLKEQFESNE